MSISRVPVIIHFQSQNPGMHMIWDKWTLYRKCLLLEYLKRNYDDLYMYPSPKPCYKLQHYSFL